MSRGSRLLIYACAFVSGAAALVLELVWQKSLCALLGSQARSVSLILTVFLAGLACGYAYWGRRSARLAGRRAVLVACGAAEGLIGLSALAFHPWSRLLGRAAVALPDGFVADLVLSAALCGAPAFLMGALVPLLTRALPDTPDEVNARQASIYGCNTLGAAVGVVCGGFWLVPLLGLGRAASVAGVADLAAGIALIAVGVWQAGRENVAGGRDLSFEHGFSEAAIVFTAFTSGLVTISLETLTVRVLGLTVGAGPYVFPLVLGLFVLGLGVGALESTRGSARALVRALGLGCAGFAIFYLAVPYFPNWLLGVRQWLGGAPGTAAWFWGATVALTAAFTFPALVSLGSVLPLVFGAARKAAADSGRVCGRLFVVNTLGTIAGACVLGQLALTWLDLDQLFKLCVVVIALNAVVLAPKSRGLALLLLACACLPRWDRASFYLGLFRLNTEQATRYTSLLDKPSIVRRDQIELYKDGPDATVAVARFERSEGRPLSRSLIVNGKSDGNTAGDYPTMALIGLLPYLAVEKDGPLRTSLVGLGTGVTAGLVASFSEVGRLDVLEIAPTVVRAAPLFARESRDVLSNPKVSLVQADAFRVFAREPRGGLDLVISEPSNPWVAGVENLYTPEFYALVGRRLTEGGLFVQWFHLYEMSEEVLSGIFGNLAGAFPHASVFLLGNGDVAVLASRAPVRFGARAQRRLREPAALSAALRAGVRNLDELRILEVFDERFLRAFSEAHPVARHELDHPWLAYRAAAAQYYDTSVAPDELLAADVPRALVDSSERAGAFGRLVHEAPRRLPQCYDRRLEILPLCQRFAEAAKSFGLLEGSAENAGWHKLLAYQRLRSSGLIAADPARLAAIARAILEGRASRAMQEQMAVALVREYERDGLRAQGAAAEARFRQAALLR